MKTSADSRNMASCGGYLIPVERLELTVAQLPRTMGRRRVRLIHGKGAARWPV